MNAWPAPARWSINGRFLSQPVTGVQRYGREMLSQIDACLGEDAAMRGAVRLELLVPRNCPAVPRLQHIAVRRVGRVGGYFWEQVTLPLRCRGGLINLANLGPLLKGRRQITCIHDANVYLWPQSYSRPFRLAYRVLLPLLAGMSRGLTTVSAFSAQTLTGLGVGRGRQFHVLPNGHEHALAWLPGNASQAAMAPRARPFVLALGSRARHKNFDLLLSIATRLDARGIDVLIAGGAGAQFATMAAGHTAPNVHFLGFVADDDLAALFEKALCFAFPSWTEGFGLPLLEAMVHGCPIVSSDTASMPEICADAALYASPAEPQAWVDAIARLQDDAHLRARLIAAGRARYPRFSWRTSALAYLRLALQMSPGRQHGVHDALSPSASMPAAQSAAPSRESRAA